MHTASRVTAFLLPATALALGIAGALAVGPAQASGFQLRENSVKNLGRANAGTAVAKGDASVVANNPAAMVNLDKTTVQVDATDIDLTAKFSGSGTSALGTPLSGGDGGDPGSPQVVPALAAVTAFGNFRLGASINAPFGLKTQYDADWVGRYNAIKSDVKTVDVTVPASVAGALGAGAPADGRIYAPLTTPTIDTLSAQWDVTAQFRLLGDIQRTGWHSLQQVAIFNADGSPLGHPEEFNWRNTTYVGIGAEWDLSPQFTLRAGLAHDQSPTSDATRDARLPDNTRKLYSIGATWHASDAFSIDAAFQRIDIDDPSIDVVSPFPGSPSPALGSRLTGKYNGHANLIGLAMQYRF